jgi:hypothetical protein
MDAVSKHEQKKILLKSDLEELQNAADPNDRALELVKSIEAMSDPLREPTDWNDEPYQGFSPELKCLFYCIYVCTCYCCCGRA